MMSAITVSVSVLTISLLLVIYRLIISPGFLSPLARVPNAHPLAPYTSLWILYIRYTSQEVATTHEAHVRLGPVIRLGPAEVSVNCVKGGIQSIYAGGFEKHEWYSNAFKNFGVCNMFSMQMSKPHSTRKRMISNVYSKSYLHNSATMGAVTKEVLFGRLLPKLDGLAKAGGHVNLWTVFNATTFDLVSGYLYGLECSSNMVENDDDMEHFLELHRNRGMAHRYFWTQELPRFTKLLERVGFKLVPDWVWGANRQIEAVGMEYTQRAEALLQKLGTSRVGEIPGSDVGYFPLVYCQLINAMGNPADIPKDRPLEADRLRRELASELIDHLLAGFETSAITLTYLAHELSKRPELQRQLKKELLTLDPPMAFDQLPSLRAATLPSPKAVDSLPLLEAILKETLRLHAAIPGPQPRITPEGGCSLGPEGEYGHIPGSVRISAQAWSLHRNAEVFSEPEKWKPERWLHTATQNEERRKMMDRWFWAFGSGGRMCVGSNLAIYQIKHIVAAIYTNFKTTIVQDEGIEQIDAYTAPPKSNKLIFKFERW